MKHNPIIGDSVKIYDVYNTAHPPVIGVVVKVFMPKVRVLLPNGKIEWRNNYEIEVLL